MPTPPSDVTADRVRDYWAGKWCGECVYGVLEDPPCCTRPESSTPEEAHS